MRKPVSLSLLFIGALAFVATAEAITMTYNVSLDGASEVGGGDPDGSGSGIVILDDSDNSISWNFSIADIATPLTGAHIHEAPAGVNGSVVVNFSAMLSGAGLVSPLVPEIIANPSNYYVNLHNADFPAGAIRGQLGKGNAQEVPDSLGFSTVATTLCLLLFAKLVSCQRRLS